jgi:hypothetical protein
MSLLLALTGGTPGADNLTIAWTQESASWSVNANAKAASSVSWTQGNDVWAVAENAKSSITVAWTQQSDTWALNANAKAPISIAWTGGADTWAINASASSTNALAISWTQGSSVWAETATASTSLAVNWTSQDDTWQLLANDGSADSLSISWISQDDSWLLSSNITGEDLTSTPGFKTLKAYTKKQETEEEKRLRREAQGIIARVKLASPNSKDNRLMDDAVDVVEQIKLEIARLDLKANYFERVNQQQNMIDAQLAQEQLQAQIQEVDDVFIMFMLLAQID